MTNRERAELAFKNWWSDSTKSRYSDTLIDAIEAQLNAAVAEERERCAKAADKFTHFDSSIGPLHGSGVSMAATQIAEEIRAGHENPQESAAGRIGNTVLDFEGEMAYIDELNKRSENPQGPAVAESETILADTTQGVGGTAKSPSEGARANTPASAAPPKVFTLKCLNCLTEMTANALAKAGGRCPVCGNDAIEEIKGAGASALTPQRLREIADWITGDPASWAWPMANDLRREADRLEGK